MISVQESDFNVAHEYEVLSSGDNTGAIVTFVGRVRDFGEGSFLLQHYPGMTERVLSKIEQQARSKWQINACRVIHRVGQLSVNDQIVFVGVSSAHRHEAFDACHFIIDILKTQAPFWKKEGETWVDAKSSDDTAADKWLRD